MGIRLGAAGRRFASKVRALARAAARPLTRPGSGRAAFILVLFGIGLTGGLVASRLYPAGPILPGAQRVTLSRAGGRGEQPSAPIRRAGPQENNEVAGGAGAPRNSRPERRGEDRPAARASGAGNPGSMPQAGQQLAMPASGLLVWPAEGLVASVSGWRRHPQRGDWTYQPGIELAVSSQAPVRAAAEGAVQEVVLEAGGYAVTVDHGSGWTSTYGKLSRVAVKPGSRVRAGSLLGYGPRVPDEAVPALAAAPEEGWPASGLGPSWPPAGRGRFAATITFEVRHGGESVDPLRVVEPGWFRVSPPDEEVAPTAASAEGRPQAAGEGTSPEEGYVPVPWP